MPKKLTVTNYFDGKKVVNYCNYLRKGDILKYTLNNELISINLKDFKFIKENKESIFNITENECRIYLKEQDMSFIIPINYINYSFVNNKRVVLEYLLESNEEKVRVEIEIEE